MRQNLLPSLGFGPLEKTEGKEEQWCVGVGQHSGRNGMNSGFREGEPGTFGEIVKKQMGPSGVSKGVWGKLRSEGS
jgi:hypothetical protein